MARGASAGTGGARDPEALIEAVERSCANKAEVVADETEQGVRATPQPWAIPSVTPSRRAWVRCLAAWRGSGGRGDDGGGAFGGSAG